MTQETVKVLWPDRLALICKKKEARVLEKDLKGDDSEDMAYAMGFCREEIVWKTVEIDPTTSKDLISVVHTYNCPLYAAYYLCRVVARPLEGKMLPKGDLQLLVDGEAIVQGPISTFLPDLKPIDCSKPHPWAKTQKVFRACVLDKEGAWGSRQLGFMLPTLSWVQVHLSDVTTEEKVALEIGIITAYYSTKEGELAKPSIPEKKE